MANAYISEGVPAEVAERYAAKSAVRSVISNSGNPETPIIMKAAQLNTTSELVEKLVGSLTGSAETVLYQSGHNIVNNRSGHRGRNRGRGNNHGNYRAPAGLTIIMVLTIGSRGIAIILITVVIIITAMGIIITKTGMDVDIREHKIGTKIHKIITDTTEVGVHRLLDVWIMGWKTTKEQQNLGQV